MVMAKRRRKRALSIDGQNAGEREQGEQNPRRGRLEVMGKRSGA